MSATREGPGVGGALFCSGGCGQQVDRPQVCDACKLRRRAAKSLETVPDRRAYDRAKAAVRRDQAAAFGLLPADEQARLLGLLAARRGWSR